MILTVTPSPALDVTYTVERLVPHASHRVTSVREVAGGKGVNVSSVLAGRGIPALATGPVGGAAGGRFVRDLDRRGVPHAMLGCAAETRRTVTVVSQTDGEATAFNEPGGPLSADGWLELVRGVADLLAEHRPDVLVASGSVPVDFPEDGYAQLADLGRAAGCTVVVDASRGALLGSLRGHPDVVKPNRHELADATGEADPVAGAHALQALGARHVVVSLGADGMVLVGPEAGVVRAAPGAVLRGNPTGAGDAAVAALAAGLAARQPWEEILADAVAWSGAAVLQPVAGQADGHDIERLRGGVRVWRD